MIPQRIHLAILCATIVVLVAFLIALLSPLPAGATPLARCQPNALMSTNTTPPHYLRCKGGLWYAVSARDYTRLMAAQKRVRP